MRARSGDRLRDDGDGDRLRLLENGRGPRHARNRHRQPAPQRRHGEKNRRAGNRKNSG